MATKYNKLQLSNGRVLMDLTQQTATAEDVLEGKYFLDANGDVVEGESDGSSVTTIAPPPDPDASIGVYDSVNKKVNFPAEKIGNYTISDDTALIVDFNDITPYLRDMPAGLVANDTTFTDKSGIKRQGLYSGPEFYYMGTLPAKAGTATNYTMDLSANLTAIGKGYNLMHCAALLATTQNYGTTPGVPVTLSQFVYSDGTPDKKIFSMWSPLYYSRWGKTAAESQSSSSQYTAINYRVKDPYSTNSYPFCGYYVGTPTPTSIDIKFKGSYDTYSDMPIYIYVLI